MIWRWLAAGLIVMVVAGTVTGIWFRPVPSNFLHYLGWRLTSGVSVEQGSNIQWSTHPLCGLRKRQADVAAAWGIKQSTELVFADTVAGDGGETGGVDGYPRAW